MLGSGNQKSENLEFPQERRVPTEEGSKEDMGTRILEPVTAICKFCCFALQKVVKGLHLKCYFYLFI